VIGDLALYHDMNGLLAAKLHGLDATVVVLNNDGGGIFSFLPQAANATHFEQLFGTPHGLQFEPAAALYGARYHRAHDGESLRRGVAAGLAGRGLHLVELRTDRARNVALHREAWAAVADALSRD
jgi:2-succinyl-5-enolpyruvyl-6-hydroxy-3-cyclohexene-1-carboxylate synthase